MSDFNEKNSKKYEYIDNVYEQIMELQSCGIIAYKLPNREVIVYNDAAKKMHGIEDEIITPEVLLTAGRNIIYDNMEEALEKLKGLKNHGDYYNYGYSIPKKDGTITHVWANTKLVEMKNGDKVIVSSIIDTSEMNELDKKFRQSSELYNRLLDLQHAGVFSYRLRDRKILHINPEALRLFDWDDGNNLTEKFLRNNIKIIDYENVKNKLERLGKDISNVQYDFISNHRDGSVVYATCNTVAFRDMDDEIIIISSFINITDNVNLQRTINREHKQYREALTRDALLFYEANLTTGIVNNTYNGNKWDTKDYQSDEVRIFDEENKKLIEKYQVQILGSNNDTYWKAEGLLQAFDSGKTNVEIDYYSELTNRYYRSTCLMFKDDLDNNVYGFVICNDITDIKKDEFEAHRKLQAAYDEAKKANAAKTTFLARMSHDIRTPINGILGILEMNEKYSDDLERVAKNREKCKVAAKHLLSLINDVLDMSKLESEDTDLNCNPLNLKTLCEEVLTIASLRAAESAIHLVYDEGKGITYPYIRGSELHIRQILINILTNAIKYNKPDGYIFFNTRLEDVSAGEVVYKFDISDTGIGMNEEFLPKVFEPFTQEKSDGRSRYQGTGLGMSIVKALVEKMGGTIEVQSKPGAGSKFTIILPFELCTETEIVATPKKRDDISIEGMKILLVEDNELNMDIAEFMLVEAGAFVEKAYNGEEAVDKFARSKPGDFDVILMDIMMPVLDGYAATRKIRLMQREDAAQIPIIAMTANAFAEDITESEKAGMNYHIAKPVDRDKLYSILAAYNI